MHTCLPQPPLAPLLVRLPIIAIPVVYPDLAMRQRLAIQPPPAILQPQPLARLLANPFANPLAIQLARLLA